MAERLLKRLTFLLALLLASLAVLTPAADGARAAGGPWLITDQSAVRLISAESGVAGEEALSLGLQFKMEPGWKIYWRSPGVAGYPPQVDWSASDNLASAETLWPLPHRFELFGLQTFGYGGEVVLPLKVTPARPGEPVTLKGAINFLTCSEICVPQEGELTLSLPAGGGTGAGENAEASLIAQWKERVPADSAPGLQLASLDLTGALEKPVLEAVARSDEPFEKPDLLVEGPPGFLFSKPEVAFSDGGREAKLTVFIEKGPLAEGVIDGKALTLTLMESGEEPPRGLEQVWHARFSSAPQDVEQLFAQGSASADYGLLAILGFALLGGLILNIMPCVLPVLSLKLLSVAKQGGRERGHIRLGFLASAAGILASFWLLALGALALKSAGMAVGWGIQFQQPLFLSAMALILTFFALNLFGFFEISLPGWAGDAAGRAPSKGLAGHFMTGALATLLATPCSAPFLGTAVGFALSRGASEILMIFTALGLGLSLPYLLVAGFPGLAARLPKPGAWMVTLRRVLGLAMAGTAVWLLTVLAAQINLMGALVVAALLLLLGVVIALGKPRALAGLLALAVLGAGLFLPAAPPAPRVASSEHWQAFDQKRIAELVAAGEVVLVDVTADWCITCKVNKSLVLERGPVFDLLQGESLVAQQADWTNPDPEIAAYLESFGRYGIPFNAVYGPGAPDGIALPELLSEAAVLEAIEKARGG
ncbi:protein-disulfide reductase DsbD family protein [Limibacillus halophilus]